MGKILIIVFFTMLLIGLWKLSGFPADSSNDKENVKTYSNSEEWPIVAKEKDRNNAFMIKAMLEESGIKAIVEEDTTLGVLYGAQSITDYPIRVSENEYQEAQSIIEESSFTPSRPEQT